MEANELKPWATLILTYLSPWHRDWWKFLQEYLLHGWMREEWVNSGSLLVDSDYVKPFNRHKTTMFFMILYVVGFVWAGMAAICGHLGLSQGWSSSAFPSIWPVAVFWAWRKSYWEALLLTKSSQQLIWFALDLGFQREHTSPPKRTNFCSNFCSALMALYPTEHSNKTECIRGVAIEGGWGHILQGKWGFHGLEKIAQW